ncbi:MAG: hypothetical protein LWW76_02300 [Burkholderiales bacterium]|nr:hypothetical protein [Burkholderiales bacterium]
MSNLSVWVVLSGWFLVILLGSCSDHQQVSKNTQELKQNTQYQLKSDCAPLIKTFDSCPTSRLSQASRERMMAVLEEQMRVLSATEAGKRCQELQDFWKVACGVAIAQ